MAILGEFVYDDLMQRFVRTIHQSNPRLFVIPTARYSRRLRGASVSAIAMKHMQMETSPMVVRLGRDECLLL